MGDIAAAIGRTGDAQRYTDRLAANRKAYHAKFWNQKGRGQGLDTTDTTTTTPAPPPTPCCYDAGGDTSNIFALHIGAVPDDLVNRTVSALVASLRNWKNRTTGTTDTTDTTGVSGVSGVSGDKQGKERGHVSSPHSSTSMAPPAAPSWGAGTHKRGLPHRGCLHTERRIECRTGTFH